ncbi:DUF3108 domain-containing protein [Sulfurimonas sp. MAG313]|nr:DUF3108 domain-containing protein [Sulfurimonas sp. MAG313]MDF1879784.1 DUF3108 domain-containing protein [Sulfurimonas sp. MAG313]
MKLFISILILVQVLFSQTFNARYRVDVGLFGSVGYSDVVIEDDGKTYSMSVTATTTGTAAVLSGNRMETYISKGKIVNGKYLSDSFYKYRKTTRKETIQTYTFNHEKEEITLRIQRSKWVKSSHFDPIVFKLIKTQEQEHSDENSSLDIYTSQDIFSSYLNALNSCNAENKVYELIAVGAHNHKKSVTIFFLQKKEKQKALELLDTDITDIFRLHIQPFSKDDTMMDILIGLDAAGHVKKAILGNVFWIGEVTSTRVSYTIAP